MNQFIVSDLSIKHSENRIMIKNTLMYSTDKKMTGNKIIYIKI